MYLSSLLVVLVGGAAMAAVEGCHADNLLRAMERHNGTAYCSSFLNASSVTTFWSLPTDAATTFPPGAVFSACSCLLGLNATSGTSCHSLSATATSIVESGGVDTATSAVASLPMAVPGGSTLGLSRLSSATFGGGYTYSFPGAGRPTSAASTCGWGEATKTVQVTETVVSTILVYSSAGTGSSSSSSASSTSSFPFPSDGDSGGRPAPPPRTSTVTVGYNATTSGSESTATLIGNSTTSPTGAGSTGALTTGTGGNSTFTGTTLGVSSDSLVSIPPRLTTVVLNGTTATITDAPLPTSSGTLITSTISSLANTSVDGASFSRTLSLGLSSSAGSTDESTTTTSLAPIPPAVTTIMSDEGGAGSTWIVTVGPTGGTEPFPNSTRTSQSLASSETASEVFSVVTSLVGGAGSTWTVIGGSTVTGSPSSGTSTPSEVPSQILTAGFTVITSVIGGVGSIWTVTGGSNTTSQPGETTSVRNPSTTPSETASGIASVITTVIGGVSVTRTVVGGTIVVPSFTGNTTFATTPAASSATESGVVSVITSIVDGIGSTWTVIGGSTVVNSPSPLTAVTSSVLSETASGAFSVITSAVGGVTSILTVVDGSTLSGSPSPTATASASASVVTSVVNGAATSWTEIGGSTVSGGSDGTTSTQTQSAGVSVITSVVGGVGSTWTVIGGSTVTGPPDASSSTAQTLPPGASVVTSVIDGVASSWTVIGGSTVFGSASTTSSANPAGTGQVTVITSVVGGAASTWTVIGGSTVSGSANNTAGGDQTASATPTVFTSVVDGVASTWTVIGGSTVFGTLTQGSTSTGSVTRSVANITGGVSTLTLSGGATFVSTLNGTIPTTTESASSTASSSSSSSSATTSISAAPTTGYASAFTGISVVAAQNGSTCYTQPIPVASLHESVLNNTGRAPPYIDAFYLDAATNSVKYLRLRNNNTEPVLVDVSDPSKVAIVDGAGNALSIDREGLHFTSANCSPKIDVFISGFFEQLSALTNTSCGGTDDVPVNSTRTSGSGPPRVFRGTLDRRQEQTFDVILRLTDQCGNPARADLPVSVSVGDTACVVLPKATGTFGATCAFPGGESGTMECETAVQQTLDHLTRGSLAGTCPPFASVWSLLSRELGGVVDVNALLQPFLDAGLDLGTDRGRGILSVIDSFLRVYDFSAAAFRNSTADGSSSGLGGMVAGYGGTAIRTDVCRSLVASETLDLTLTAGAAATPVPLANISAVPSPAPEYERNVTDPTALACCPNPSKCVVGDGEPFYPAEASIEGSDCLCGTTLGAAREGQGVGFRTGRCLGYDQCNATSPCAAGGAVCLVDSCCGFSVCVNGTECSAPRAARRWANLFGTETSGGMF